MNSLSYGRRIDFVGIELECLFLLFLVREKCCCVRHGDYDKLEYRTDFPVPELTPQDVLIRVSAAGVNNTDINTRNGWYSKGDNDDEDASWAGKALKFPHIQGADACGRCPQMRSGDHLWRIKPAGTGK